MSEDIVGNLTRPAVWVRILFMIGFAVALYVTTMVLLVVILAQILFSLVNGTDNANLRRSGAALTEYVRQILEYLTFNSELRPFPFSPFPDPSPVARDENAGASAAQAPTLGPGPDVADATGAAPGDAAVPASSPSPSTTPAVGSEAVPNPAAAAASSQAGMPGEPTIREPSGGEASQPENLSGNQARKLPGEPILPGDRAQKEREINGEYASPDKPSPEKPSSA